MAADLQQGMESRDDPTERVVYYKTARVWEGYNEHQISSLADHCFRKHCS